MAPDDPPVLAADDDGIYEPELLDGSGQRLKFDVVDAARVGRVEAQRIDRDMLDCY